MTDDKQVRAELDYKAGMKYKDIAAKYEVTMNTVKSWKTRNHWSRDAPTSKNGAHTTKKGAHSVQKRVQPKPTVPQAIAEADLPEKRKLFAVYYLQSFNATKAYMQAYGGKYNVANVEGPRLLVNPSVKKLIDDLKAEQSAELHMTQMDVLQDLAKQVRADVGDYLDYGSEQHLAFDYDGKPILDFETGKQKVVTKTHVYLKPQNEVDTSLLKSVAIDEYGNVKLDTYDKLRAADMLLKNMPKMDDSKGQAVTKINFIRTNRSVKRDGADSQS